MSMSVSRFCSAIRNVELVLGWADDCRQRDCDEDDNGGEFSSSDESAGVIVWVESGAGLFRED